MLRVDVLVRRGGFELEAAFSVARGELLAIMGANGSGKSTLLGAIAGTVPLAAGGVELEGRMLSQAGRHLVPVSRRGVGMLWQESLLFPHLSVLKNVEFGASRPGIGWRPSASTGARWLAALQLEGLAHRRPRELSGGQQRRVAIARALAAEPHVLLLDEPLASVDAASAATIRSLLRDALADRAGVLVTHDVADALALADRVILLERGRIVRSGPAREVLATLGAGLSAEGTVGPDGSIRLPGGIRLDPGSRVTVTAV